MVYEMPEMDEELGRCGAYHGGEVCRRRSVARVVVETYDYDYDYEQAYGASLGEAVMVEVCVDHKDGVIAHYEQVRAAAAASQVRRSEAQVKVDAAKAALEQAQHELDRI